MTRLYILLNDLRLGVPLEQIEIFLLFAIFAKTIIMFVCTGFLIRNGVKQRKFIWELRAVIPFWFGWICILIIESIPSGIGAGFGPYGPYEHLILLLPIYICFFVYTITSSWVLPLVSITKFYKRKRYVRGERINGSME